MTRISLSLVAAVACLATAPLAAQQPQTAAQHASAPVAQAQQAIPVPPAPGGPRLGADFKSFRPKLSQEEAATAASAAASTTTITISTLGLVLLAVLLILLLS